MNIQMNEPNGIQQSMKKNIMVKVGYFCMQQKDDVK
jgi:hypothetical protein